ncbi:hypothetical protein ACI797_23710 [Geodermatophilus sp. SYSU D00691]
MMRTSKLVLAGAGIAAATAVGSAFTASNTVAASVAGYGEGTVTGTAVTDIDYTPVTGDASRLDSVVFTTTEDNSGRNARLVLKNNGSVVGSQYTCSITTTTITCNLGDDPAFTTFNTVGLSVYDNE